MVTAEVIRETFQVLPHLQEALISIDLSGGDKSSAGRKEGRERGPDYLNQGEGS